MVGFIGTSVSLGEMQAAGMGALIFGGAVVIIGLLLCRFLFTGPKVKSSGQTTAA